MTYATVVYECWALVKGQSLARTIDTKKGGRARRNPGPKQLDAIEQLRILHWYWNLRIQSGLTDYKLYLACFSTNPARPVRGEGADRQRVFERVRKEYARPDRKDKRRPYILLDVVEERFPGTRAAFDSDFWAITVAPRLSHASLIEIINRQLDRCGFLQRSVRQLTGAARRREDPIESWPSELHRKAFTLLSSRGDLGSLTLLTALAIELQMQRPAPLILALSQELHMHCSTAFGRLVTKPEWRPIRAILWLWYQQRIFHGIWDNDWIMSNNIPESTMQCLMPLVPTNGYSDKQNYTAPTTVPVKPERFKKTVFQGLIFLGLNPPWEDYDGS